MPIALTSPNRPRRPLCQALCGLLAAVFLSGCAQPLASDTSVTQQRVLPLLPADVLILGEQHDAPDHHRIEGELVQVLAARDVLAALALEMAEQGRSTATLDKTASEDEVRAALQWNTSDWPWAPYSPAVMAAVRAGVPVLGANLPAAQMREAMGQRELDYLLKGPALKAQQQLIRLGHCEMLPESQITPMTRIQIARDRAMAQAIERAAVTGKTVLLLAGRGHADRSLGVPQHLRRELNTKAIAMFDGSALTEQDSAKFDAHWSALPAPEKDYCAEFKTQRDKRQQKMQGNADNHE